MLQDIMEPWPTELVQRANQAQTSGSFQYLPYLWLACSPQAPFDVTLQSKSGGTYGFHKKVLSVVSPVFRTILQTDSSIKTIPLSQASSEVIETFQFAVYLHGSYNEVKLIMEKRDATWKAPTEKFLLDISRFSSKYDVQVLRDYVDTCISYEEILFRDGNLWKSVTTFFPEVEQSYQMERFEDLTFQELQTFEPDFVVEVLQYQQDVYGNEIELEAEYFAKLMQYTMTANHKALEEKFLTFCKSDYMKAVVKTQCNFTKNSKI